LLSIAEAFTRLEETPERFRVYYNGFRRILTERFPYGFFIESQATESSSFESSTMPVTILAISREHEHVR